MGGTCQELATVDKNYIAELAKANWNICMDENKWSTEITVIYYAALHEEIRLYAQGSGYLEPIYT